MKKLLAIVLLTIYLLNLTGYSLIFQYMIDDADTQLVRLLDNNRYEDKDLLQLKVALHMPYLTTTKDFVRVDGTIELNGIQYNYVKRKVAGDTLYLLCLPNFPKTQLCNAKADYAKENSDLPPGEKSTESVVKKAGFGNEYNCTTTYFNFSVQPLSHGVRSGFICAETPAVFIESPLRPPDFNC